MAVPMSNLINAFRRRLLHLFFLMRRPMTLGVRAVVTDDAFRKVLLVRHTYVGGWHLPGGGVDPGETAVAAIERELLEEAGVRPKSPPQLKSVHFNRASSRRDHVLLYVVHDYERIAAFVNGREIAESGFFDLDQLPAGLHASSRQRIAETRGTAEVSYYW